MDVIATVGVGITETAAAVGDAGEGAEVGGIVAAGAATLQAATTNAKPALVNSDRSCFMHQPFLKREYWVRHTERHDQAIVLDAAHKRKRCDSDVLDRPGQVV